MNKRLGTIRTTCVALALLALPLVAWAQPKITMSVKAEKEVTVKQNGKTVIKKIVAKNITPGETITYRITYKNEGNELAKDVVISDPIPQGCAYIAETAEGKDTDITYSIDKGKTFNKPTILTYESAKPGGTKEKKIASTDEYTNIRWIVKSVPAGASGSVSFKVKVL